MPARPAPNGALALCKKLAANSRARLDTMIETLRRASVEDLGANARELKYYNQCIALGEAMRDKFKELEKMRLPAVPPGRARKIGRPSKKDLAKRAKR